MNNIWRTRRGDAFCRRGCTFCQVKKNISLKVVEDIKKVIQMFQ